MPAQQQSTFTTWKEIADYIGKGIRTVQRWEARLGLPIQRPNEHYRGIVCASRDDLDNWLRTQWKAGARSTGITIVRHNDEPLQLSRELRKRLTLLRCEVQSSCVRLKDTLNETAHIIKSLSGNIPNSTHESQTGDSSATAAGT